GAQLFIDERVTVDNGGAHRMRIKRNAVVLAAGEHRLRLEYAQGTGYHGCRLHWWGDGAERAPFPLIKPARSTAASDAKGDYRLRHLPPGRYQVRAHVPAGFAYATNGTAHVGTQVAELGTRNSKLETNQTSGTAFLISHDSRFEGVNIKTGPFKK